MRNTPKEVARKKNKHHKQQLQKLITIIKEANSDWNPNFDNRHLYYPKTENQIIFFKSKKIADKALEIHKELTKEFC